MHTGNRRAQTLMLAIALLCALPAVVSADVVLLKNGGELRGEIRSEPKSPANAQQITVRTLTGAIIVIDRSEAQSITRRPLKVEEYLSRRKHTPDTADDLWDLAEWCRKHSLGKEREAVLQRVIELDPENAQAHRGLGHIYRDNKWTTTDEVMTAQGYVKYKGKYMLPQELELLERTNTQNEQEKGWFKRVYVLHNWLHGSYDAKREEALRELEKIEDADAVPALARSFRNDPSENYRLIYVKLLGRLDSLKATEALAWQSLQDDSANVRQEALQGVGNGDRAAAMGYYVRALRDKSNSVVLRSAIALGEYGDAHVIPNLIDALVTEHTHIVTVPEVVAGGLSFNVDGTVGGHGQHLPPQVEAMLRNPYNNPNTSVRMRQIAVKQLHENNEVLVALKKLSGEDFGYDEKTWRLWWNQHKVDLGKVKNS